MQLLHTQLKQQQLARQRNNKGLAVVKALPYHLDTATSIHTRTHTWCTSHRRPALSATAALATSPSTCPKCPDRSSSSCCAASLCSASCTLLQPTQALAAVAMGCRLSHTSCTHLRVGRTIASGPKRQAGGAAEAGERGSQSAVGTQMTQASSTHQLNVSFEPHETPSCTHCTSCAPNIALNPPAHLATGTMSAATSSLMTSLLWLITSVCCPTTCTAWGPCCCW